MTEADLIALVNFTVLLAFWALLFVGTISTLARYARYRAHRMRRPRLLIRDAVLIGGFALSFGIILFVRVIRDAGFDTAHLAEQLWWTVVTSAPALIAVGTYVYFELFVIERGSDIEHRATPRSEDPS